MILWWGACDCYLWPIDINGPAGRCGRCGEHVDIFPPKEGDDMIARPLAVPESQP